VLTNCSINHITEDTWLLVPDFSALVANQLLLQTALASATGIFSIAIEPGIMG
jgi:hypothetical protein